MKMSEWQGGSGRWFVACTDDLANNSGHWVYVARKLGLPPHSFMELLHKDYKAEMYYNPDTGFLMYWWNNYGLAHKFTLDMNKRLRSIN